VNTLIFLEEYIYIYIYISSSTGEVSTRAMGTRTNPEPAYRGITSQHTHQQNCIHLWNQETLASGSCVCIF
jgi:hypothetical protein